MSQNDLMDLSIKDNILYSNTTASNGQINKCLQKVQALSKIKAGECFIKTRHEQLANDTEDMEDFLK